MASEYRLHHGVFYRIYDERVVLYQTEQKKIFHFNETVKDVLDCFGKTNNTAEVVDMLKKLYDVDDIEEFEKSILAFINDLANNRILVPVFHEKEKVNHLESRVARSFIATRTLFSATIELTYKCNEHCQHCFIVDENEAELSTNKIKEVIDELKTLNVLNLVFTGGEVFTRTDSFEIFEYAYRSNFAIDIFTNGTLLSDDDIFRLKALWPRSVSFSIYSHIPEKHDTITQIKGSFEKTINTLRKCALIGIPINIKAPILKYTIDDISGIIKLAESLEASIQIGMTIVPKKDGDLSPTKLRVDDIKNYQKIIAAGAEYIKGIGDEYELPERTDRICNAGEYSISIDPYGNVFPCNTLLLNLGNVTTSSIKTIWERSETLLHWRKVNSHSNTKECVGCENIDVCVFCPGEALMRTGDPLMKYENACTLTKAWVDWKKYNIIK